MLLIGLLVVRGVWANHYFIPSGSMLPTLEIGDQVLVLKRAYDRQGPARGDVVVFEYPRDPSQLFVKRVIALPGDHVVLRDGRLILNGESARYEALFVDASASIERECLASRCHRIRRLHDVPQRDFDFVVDDGHYFVMGDNRDDSADSRTWGLLARDRIVGRSARVLWNLGLRHGLPSGDLSRVGLKL